MFVSCCHSDQNTLIEQSAHQVLLKIDTTQLYNQCSYSCPRCVFAVEVYNMYVVIQLNFKQNIETLNKISSIIGKKEELPEGQGENKSKIDLSLVLAAPAYVAMVAYQLQDCLMPMPHPRHINVTSHDTDDKINHNLPNLRL